MHATPISNLHRHHLTTAAPWAWLLSSGEAITLAADAAPRWLRVDAGCVWLTALAAPEQPQDIWLTGGDSMALPAGSAWVLEAWPQARLSVLLAAPVASSRAAFSQDAVSMWRALLARPAAARRQRSLLHGAGRA